MSKEFLSGERMVERLIRMLLEAKSHGRRVFICGNGGSAANAMHIANDWLSVGLPVQSLVSDIASLTAIANDYSFAEIFSRQLRVHAASGDIVILLSGSGTSPNIVYAAAAAKELGTTVVVITGAWAKPAPPILDTAHLAFRIGTDMQDAEGAQLFIGHTVYKILKEQSQ